LLNNNLFDVTADILEPDTANFEYVTEVKEKATKIIIHKIDSNGEYVEGAILQILDGEGNVLSEWTTEAKPHKIVGLALGGVYTLHECYVDPIYAIADDMEIKITDGKEYQMIDGIISMKTSACFRETGDRNYVNDGVAHIIDRIEYEWLYPGRTYVMKGLLIDKGTDNDLQEVILEVEKSFVPEEKFGVMEMEYVIDLDGYAEHDFVIYERLYLTEGDEEILVFEHHDYDCVEQTVHIGTLYTTGMVLYKIGNGNVSNKLNGAYYDIKTKRTKRDGTVVEKDLGIHLTGGIFLQDDRQFEVTVYRDGDLTDKVKTYGSSYDRSFKKQAVSIVDLPEGRYYVKKGDDIMTYDIVKGAIILNDQPEDTYVTYTEVKAPSSYRIDTTSYTFSAGHDYSRNVLENYRTNYLIYIPITGVD
ncbi:MAG: VaFE repeat-containing surface-anchored protein, partial [Erysipelotrichaceae bacterium]|nr:VaFE repeat-containing surface-anchored protein [Erysipelotrichaceae bacterium]